MAARKTTAKPNVSKDELLTYYREMLLIRRLDEACKDKNNYSNEVR